jgi:hypothetical protein
VDSDDVSQIASIFDNTTAAQITEFYGANYFGTGENNQSDGVYGYVLGLIFFGMFFLILLINTSAVRKNYRKSESRLYELGKLDEAEAEYSRRRVSVTRNQTDPLQTICVLRRERLDRAL